MSGRVRALLLALVAVAIPSASWFLAARREADRTVRSIAGEPEVVARLAAQRCARRIASALGGAEPASAAGLAAHCSGEPLPIRVEALPPALPSHALLRIGGGRWRVAADVAPLVDAIRRRQAIVRTRLTNNFSLGVVAALLVAGLLAREVSAADGRARERALFAAAAAHELRSPIAGLRLSAELSAASPALLAEAERLSHVVDNVLRFAGLEEGAPQVDVRRADLAATLRELALRKAPSFAVSGASLALDLPESELVPHDPAAVSSVVGNLLDNAERAVRRAADRTVRLELALVRGAAEIAVVDRGPGVSRALRRRLFRPFPPGRASGGLGIGLFLAARLARAQGGTLRCDAAAEGARFVLRLPAG